VLEKLMAGKDAIYIMKWKEIYQVLEDALDFCEDCAVMYSTLKMKYG
jgi:uncharacterized protein Yka (UPF0111/DUF47 family)